MSTYVFTDLHGSYKLWEQIKALLTENDTAYCLGDCVDRGPDGVRILEEVLADPRITLLQGNHEEFVYKYAYQLRLLGDSDYASGLGDIWIEWNGGRETYEYIKKHYTIYETKDLCEKLEKLPKAIDVEVEDRVYHLSHAGYSPWVSDHAHRSLYGSRENRYIWDRSHLGHGWSETPIWDNHYVIHGHTPVMAAYQLERHFDGDPMIAENHVKAVRYPSGNPHKVDLDLGAFLSGAAAVYKLEDDSITYIYNDTIYKPFIKELQRKLDNYEA